MYIKNGAQSHQSIEKGKLKPHTHTHKKPMRTAKIKRLIKQNVSKDTLQLELSNISRVSGKECFL